MPTTTFDYPARAPNRLPTPPAAATRLCAAPAMARVVLIGNHLPRRCGIATFTADLTDALSAALPQLACAVVAMDEPGGTHAYPARVTTTIVADELAHYQAAAAAVNASGADVVSLQHEYGIYGGPAGAHVLTLVRALRAPVVTTLHTILAAPSPAQRAVMDELTRRSQRLVVMSARGVEILRALHDVPADKIDLIPHGIPDFPNTRPAAPASLLTFGLLARDKGLEYVIDAMPAILRRHPGATYVIVGATHPHVRARDGEAYRDMLRARAAAGGVAGSVIFHDRFVDKAELAAFLGAATIYVTPYLKPEQITSGTLAFAIGAGKAVISTPYVYAEELLAEGRGLLVPWRDPAAIAAAVTSLLDDPAACQAMSARAAAFGRAMRWPQVARAYLHSFEQARGQHALRAIRPRVPAALPPLALAHVDRLTDDTGILQHALVTVPRYADGYCLDDNARALLLSARLEQLGTTDLAAARARAGRYLAFVNHALTEDGGRFHNFMDYRRAWTEPHGSDDGHGRALWALGRVVAGYSGDPGHRLVGDQLLRAGLPAVATMSSPRAWAYALLGLAAAIAGRRRRPRAGREPRDAGRSPARPVPPHRDAGVAMVRGPPHLLQPAAVRGAGRHRPRRRRSRDDRRRPGALDLAWPACRPPPTGPSRRSAATGSTRATARGPASTSSRSRPGRWCRPASTRPPRPMTHAGPTARSRLRLVPRPQPAAAGRCTTRPPAAAATASTPTGSTRTRAPSRPCRSCWRWSSCHRSLATPRPIRTVRRPTPTP
jgi:glycosyltransferase involved in cell wall biosynthesis